MTRDRGIPNRRLPKSSPPQNRSQSSDLPPAKSSAGHQPTPIPWRSPVEPPRSPVPPPTPKQPLVKRFVDIPPHQWKQFLHGWKLAAVLGLAVTSGLTALSIGFLFKLPAVPNCPAIFWPLASASLRLHCAQLAANKQTVNDLLEAIKLVSSLPENHPLNDEIGRLVEQWSSDILRLADEAFHAGKLNEAIDIARKIPKNSSAAAEIETKISQWQSIWSDAEAIYQRAEDFLRKQNWRKASLEAARLLSIDNNFWQTTQYQELTGKIATTREEINKLAKAQNLADQGGVNNLLEAIKIASSINDKSYIYQDAQDMVAKVGQKMLDLAQATLDRRDLEGALSIISKIPATAKLQREVEDFDLLARAQAKAWGGTVADIEAAIAQAQKLELGRPLYEKAQRFVTRWQLEKSDIAQLERARQLAQSGKPDDLQAAIAQASLVPSDNPRAKEAQQLADEVSGRMETLQDRPILDQAMQLADRGDVDALRSAIGEARRISPGRTLYEEAQAKIQQWRSQLARQEDQPALDQADGLAESGDLSAAIRAAQQVDLDSPLYQDAQAKARSWQERLQAESNLQAARETANGGTPDALAAAIRFAEDVPSSSPLRLEANQAIGQWSQQILQAAISQSATDISGAIVTAQKIPPRSEAYAEAQLQIQAWKKSLGQ